MNKTIQKIAFFDIDYTILKINSGEALIKQAYRKRLISTIGIAKAIYAGLQYKYSLRDAQKIIDKMGGWLKGFSEEKINKVAEEIFHKDILPNIRPNIIKEIDRLKKQGTEIVILSSSIQSVCIPLGEHLDFDEVLCSELEVKDGKYTGRPVGQFCFRKEKLIRLKEFCDKRGCDLKDASYYADSIDDLPALEKVGYPICVSPDKKLTGEAQKRGWIVQNW